MQTPITDRKKGLRDVKCNKTNATPAYSFLKGALHVSSLSHANIYTPAGDSTFARYLRIWKRRKVYKVNIYEDKIIFFHQLFRRTQSTTTDSSVWFNNKKKKRLSPRHLFSSSTSIYRIAGKKEKKENNKSKSSQWLYRLYGAATKVYLD